MIRCNGLKKRYGTHEVLKGISFDIPAGHIFGLLGPSGAGKTTLIRILTGQLSYEEGEVSVMGKRPERLSGKEKKGFGIMMDSFGLYERFSCEENLAVFADLYDVPRKRTGEILKEVGLEEAAKRKASDLSKGMRSRLQLARAFMHTPEIIFLDEPTSGLDPQTMKAIHRIILKKKEEGCTIFLTTHNMEEAAKLCDEIALLNEGTFVEEGKPEEICRRYDHHRRIKMHLSDGSDSEFDRDADSAEQIYELLMSGKVVTIHSTEPTLETVFLELTGRELEEDR
ncbi:MAG: ABC transporter ATP-binding protein [Lachnospiraceae bacterium]|nr:ABC transporter ATP-binding protein [Lachnospiraceae bacterium]